jgi:hypothetical protein
MKTSLTLVRVGGAINALFVLFHLLLAWKFHGLTQAPVGLRVMLEIFNGCGSLSIVFLAVVGLAFPREAIATAIGRFTLSLGAAIYILRAALEYALSPSPSPVIAAVCLLTGAVYVAAFVSAHTNTLLQTAN